MNAQAEELTRRVHAARIARLNAQRMRLLAVERVEKLERELQNTAESGLRVEISRTLEARGRLQAAIKRKSAARYKRIATLGLLLGAVTSAFAWTAMRDPVASGQTVRQAPLLGTVPGDQLKLAFSYSVSLPAAR